MLGQVPHADQQAINRRQCSRTFQKHLSWPPTGSLCRLFHHSPNSSALTLGMTQGTALTHGCGVCSWLGFSLSLQSVGALACSQGSLSGAYIQWLIGGHIQWLSVAGTQWLTFSGWHLRLVTYLD